MSDISLQGLQVDSFSLYAKMRNAKFKLIGNRMIFNETKASHLKAIQVCTKSKGKRRLRNLVIEFRFKGGTSLIK